MLKELSKKRNKAREEFISAIKFAFWSFLFGISAIMLDRLTNCFEGDCTGAMLFLFAGIVYTVYGVKAYVKEARILRRIKTIRHQKGGRRWMAA